MRNKGYSVRSVLDALKEKLGKNNFKNVTWVQQTFDLWTEPSFLHAQKTFEIG